MTKAQQEDLFIEWELYEPRRQQAIIDEYRLLNKGNYCRNSFFEYLKDRLGLEGYWKQVGLA
jgi:hypothetical protein